MRVWLALAFLCAFSTLANAQAVTCSGSPALSPTSITFTASPDHNATQPVTGVVLLTKYAGAIFKSGDSTPTVTVDFGKPTPNGSNAIALANVIPQTLAKDTVFCLRLDAVGPGGTGSTAPVPFDFPTAVQAPRPAPAVSLQ